MSHVRGAARVVWLVGLSAATIAVLFLFVFPTRTYLDQRRQLLGAADRVHVLAAQNAVLTQRVDQLHSDAEIERLAREQYHLVKPGEQAFVMLPPSVPSTTTTLATGASPKASAPHGHGGLWSRLTGWL
jgi:cell division protein FtsB